MDVLPGYTLGAIVRQGESAVVYRGVSADGRRVVVKLLRSQQPSPRELAELRHAFELGRELDSPAAVRTLALEASGDRSALVFEDTGGRFLDELLGAPMEVGRALHLAVGIAEALVDLHGHGVIHKDVCPENLVVTGETGRVQLTDFSLASRGGSERSSLLPMPRQVVGSLPYLSPEQTGRVDRPLDARTDLYSTGVVLYRVFTGQLPFHAEDPLGWIHSHLARMPRPLVELQPHLPAVVSDLVMRLLAKAPEDRYPTAQALLIDLLNCRQQWTANQRIEPFALGTGDALGQLRTPQLIQLREAELAQLRSAFERVVTAKLPELFLVIGEAGVGKSSLVTQLRSTVLDQGGLFLTGKFDQQQEAPYAAFAHAFQPLFRQLAAEEEPLRARWRARLDAAIGTSGQLIADLIPELLLVTGRLPEVPPLPPVEAQSRFLQVFRQLLEVLTEEYPVTLFLDDLLAARRAKTSSAHAAAIRYLQAGLSLLAPDPWTVDHELAQSLHQEEAENALCTGNLDTAERILGVLLAHARTPAERASAYRARIDLHTTRGELGPAVDSASACLRQYGIELSPHPTPEQLEEANRTVEQLLGEQAIEALLNLPPMRDADMAAAMSVMATFLPTAYFCNPQLHHQVACQMMILTLRHGLTSASTVGLTAYGFELVITHKQYARAGSFARVALALVERHGFVADEAKVCLLVGVTLLPWVEPARSLYIFLERALRAGRRAGDVFFVCLGLTHRCLLPLAAGERLEEVERAARAAADFTRGVGNEPLLICAEIVQRFTQALRGRPPALPLEKLEEAAFAERVSRSPLFVSFWYRFHRLQLHLIQGNRAVALAEARQLSGIIVSQRGQYGEAHAVFLVALALAAHAEEAPAEEQARLRAELDAHHAFLRNLAAFCPANFLAFEALVTAEVARLHGRTEEAGESYERALRAARASGLLQYAALAGEHAARFYRSRGLRTIAEAYLEEAWSAYQEWGAESRLRQLEQLHPRLEERLSRVLPRHLYAEPAQLDARAMVHASQVLSQEIVLPRLLEKLLRSALEQAGAERGYLMTLEGGRPLVRVAAQLTESGVQVSVFGEPAAPGAELPGSLLTHVQRMRQPVLLDDASQPSPFSSDPYFASLRVHSVLCIPLVRQADLAGMLYLENNQLAGAFTSERILTLEVLAAQAAISLENARLYQAAQEAVRVRDDFLGIASHELKTPITAMKLQVQSIRRAMGTRTHEAHTEDRLGTLLKTFERHVSRLAYLADEMLEVSRLKAGALALSLTLEEVDLSALVREQVDTLADRLKAASCPVAFEFEEPVVGRWDRLRLGRLVTSLILNAMKFGAGCPITVRTRMAGGLARLEVQDRGGGVDRADQARIFERFEQAAPAHHYGGLGLGLYLARETVRAHGGTISVESALGAGATFVVELPLKPPGPAAS